MSDDETPPKHIKTPMSDDEDIEPPAFSPATLGLHRVGTLPPKPQPSQPIQMLNARGMPARVRKRNRLFFDDELINDNKALGVNLSPRKQQQTGIISKPSSPVKTPSKGVLKKRKTIGGTRFVRYEEKQTPEKRSPSKFFSSPTASTSRNALIPADKRMGQQIGLRLRNLLKLPKAHKWVIFEWFYSFVDKPLFEGENEFQICLNESFPNLKTRQLTRAEWQKMRSLMGKPRRCSQAFFEEERRELERKRQKIRFLQTRKQAGDINNFVRDLPDKIPLPLPVGTKVTARLRVPQDGIFSGSVDAFDSLSSTYRVSFDRNGLGTHSIPDFEIVSDNFDEMLPLNSLMQDFRPRYLNGNLIHSPSRSRNSLNRSDPLLGQQQYDSPFKNPVIERDTIGGFPVKLLETIVRLKRAIAVKKSKLNRLRDMNAEAEIKNAAAAASSSSSAGEHNLSEEFQRRYASIVISMEKMNRDMQEYLNGIQSFASDLTRDPQVQAMLAPSYLREKCRESADDSVLRNNQGTVQDHQVLRLIKNLATVLLVASHLSSDSNSQVTRVLEGCIEEVKAGLLDSDNVEVFQKHVQIHLHHIRLGIGQLAMTPSRNAHNATMTGPTAGTSDESGRSTPV
ncbi:protein lin-9 homolog [Eupeodes corollae]|uniref:protein lin-9 homolog n=1 Tax=Eupeodes corollae TaxID=290404 RepID=UPI002490A704|nr:protein lin-9 homolog [Eupeodes corollae]